MSAYLTRCFPLVLLLLLAQACEQDAPASAPTSATGGPLFDLLPGEETGIDFVNRIVEDHEVNIFTLSHLYNGGGVAVLDYDQDGLQDVYFVSNQFGNKLYHNDGNFRFTDVTESAGVAAADGFDNGVAVVDLNADGYPDIYLSRGGIDNEPLGQRRRVNLAFINQGDGTFREMGEEIGLAANRHSVQAYFFDADRDGDLDCYLINTPTNFKTSNTLRIFPAKGGGYARNAEPDNPWESDQFFRNDNGKFVDASAEAGIRNRAFGLSATIADFNDDGYLDVFVGNDYVEPDFLYINQGDGTFKDEVDRYFRHLSNHTMGTDVGDINNDGRLDLVAVDMLAAINRRRKELDTTMRPDRYNSLLRYGYGHQQMWNTLQLNMGNGQYSDVGAMTGISATDWSWTALFADLDNSGRTDLYITNGYRHDIMNMDYLTYVVDSVNHLGGNIQALFPDYEDYLRLMPAERIPNHVFSNEADLAFADKTQDWGLDQPSFSSGAAYADLDNDGDLDLIVSNIDDPAFVYRNNGPGGNYLQVTAKGHPDNPAGYGLLVTVRNGAETYRQQLMPIRGFTSTVHNLAHFGLGQDDAVDQVILQWPDGRTQVLEDVAANQRIVADHAAAGTGPAPALPTTDFAAFSFPGDQRGLRFTHVENNFDDLDREPLLPHRISREGPALATADVDGNGTTDVFVGGAAGQVGKLFLQTSNGAFREADLPTVAGREATDAVFFDADGDGDADLYVVNGGNARPEGHAVYQDELLLNDGAGNFTPAPAAALPRIGASGGAVVALDVEGDGDTDLVVGGRTKPGRYPEAPRSLLLLNEGGRFTDATADRAPELERLGMVTDLAAGDLDGDGTDEIVAVGEWMPVTVFRRGADGTYAADRSPAGLARTEGLWQHVSLADLDGDGRPDLIAGNQGTNSRFRPTEEYPLELYSADFDDNGQVDPILAIYEDGVQYPFKNRMNLGKQMPQLKKKFPRNDPFAVASIDRIFGAEALAAADRKRVYDLRSAVFLNRADGFERVNLPAAAQVAPVRDAAVSDLDGDGRPDLVLLGNDYGTEVEIGRYDSGNGVVLLNRPDDRWEVVDNTVSGFWAGLDARELALLPLADGRTGYFIANNNAGSGLYVR